LAAVSRRIQHDATRYGFAVAAGRGGQAGGLGHLPIVSAHRGAQVVQAVPDLDDNEHTLAVVADPHVDRA
jgi:hypothetical protein